MALLTDGFATTYAIQGISPKFEEVTVKPFGLDAGGEVDQTSMRNTRYRTALGKKLVTTSRITAKVKYDVQALPQILAILGVNKYITVTFPDGATAAFYGVVDKFEPDEHKEGELPLATMEIFPSNLTTAATPVESGPVYTTATTTTTAAP